jgi:hypothetical protein
MTYLNFSVGILEYCHPDKRIERENYYFGLLNPEYNVLKVAGTPPIIKAHTVEARLKLSHSSELAIPVKFKDIQDNQILEFPSINAAAAKLGVKHERLSIFISRSGGTKPKAGPERTSLSTHESLPLKGRYILESAAIPKKKITLNKENFNKLLVTDVTLGVPNQTIYSSIANFAKAINTFPSYISNFLFSRKKVT